MRWLHHVAVPCISSMYAWIEFNCEVESQRTQSQCAPQSAEYSFQITVLIDSPLINAAAVIRANVSNRQTGAQGSELSFRSRKLRAVRIVCRAAMALRSQQGLLECRITWPPPQEAPWSHPLGLRGDTHLTSPPTCPPCRLLLRAMGNSPLLRQTKLLPQVWEGIIAMVTRSRSSSRLSGCTTIG